MLLPMVSRPFAFLERRGQRALLEIARAFQSAPGSSGISTQGSHAPPDFRRRLKVSMPFVLMAGQLGTPNSRAALSAVSMPGALYVPSADK